MVINYIKEMRKLIGNRPLLLVGTSVIAVRDGMVLLQRRADNGLWGYPGGCMELGENPEESAKREFKEETGYITQEIELYGVFSGERRHYTYPNGHEVYITDVVYYCSDCVNSGDSHDNEVLEVKWFPINELPPDLTPTTEDILKKFASDYINKKMKTKFQV